MTTFYLPFTAFQYASAIRAMMNGVWRPSNIVLLHGAGTTNTKSGKLYFKAFIEEANKRNIDVNIKKANIFNYILCAISMNKNSTFVTGNLRRYESLYLGYFSNGVVLLDDGLGAILPDGYLSINSMERSLIKKIAIKLRIMPNYRTIYSKIILNPTIFQNSIFPKKRVLDFYPIKLSEKILVNCPHTILIVSKIAISNDLERYVEWINKNFHIANGTVLSMHPQISSDKAKKLSKMLNLPILDTQGVLLEDYIYNNSRKKIRLIGEENTSTTILRQLNYPYINASSYI